MAPNLTRYPKWIIVVAAVLALLISSAAFVFWRTRHMDDVLKNLLVHDLEQRFDSRVELAAVHVSIFPQPSVAGENLTIHFHQRTDIPPLIHIDKFSAHLGFLNILRLPHHIDEANVERMTITIPPRNERKSPAVETDKPKRRIPSVIVDRVVCKDTLLVMLPKKAEPGKPEKDPLEWDIHDLAMHSASADKPFSFHGRLTNAKPKGEIDTIGDFGPWDLDDPGSTPVSGSYKFAGADLGPFPGIAGILSSNGKYAGQLSELRTEGVTDIPDFSLDKVGKPVALHTDFSATVDGTNGDTQLHPVRATLGRTVIVAEGSVINVRGKGYHVSLDVNAPNARIEDILSLAVSSNEPILTGPTKIKAKLILPPGKEKVLDKMILDGQVGIEDAKWASPEVRGKLESLSRRAEGKPNDDDAGSSVSDLKGIFHVEKGVVTFSSLTFEIPGATIDLAGRYDLRGGALDLNGHLRMKARISQTVTGTKSFFLKLVDPFFQKNGAGADVPISISGTRDNPVVGVKVFHKTIKKDMKGSEKDSNKGSKN
jgi:hypothetical protein